MKQTPSQAGFSMIELLMAMAVFSFMMMIVSAGFIHVVRIHQSGIASRTTQQNARLVMDTIVKDIRLSGAAVSAGNGNMWRVCLNRGSRTVQYAVNATGNLRMANIATPTAGTCPDPTGTANFSANTPGVWNTINDSRVEVTQFRVDTTPAAEPGLGTAMVTLTLASKNNLDALDATRTRCTPGTGSQFCAVTTLTSGASLRGGSGL